MNAAGISDEAFLEATERRRAQLREVTPESAESVGKALRDYDARRRADNALAYQEADALTLLAECDAEGWPQEKALDSFLPVMAFDARAMLPGPVADIVEAVARANDTAPEMAAAAILGAGASLMGNRYQLRPFRNKDIVQRAALWVCIWAPSSEGKSSATAPILRVLRGYAADAAAAHDSALLAWKAAQKAAEQAAKGKESPAELEARLREEESPPVRRYFTVPDVTEAGVQLALQSGDSALLDYDELATLADGKSQYDIHEKKLLRFYDGYRGAEAVRAGAIRAKEASRRLELGLLSIVGTTQPLAWKERMRKCGAGTDGYRQRFLTIAPDFCATFTNCPEARARMDEALAQWRSICDVLREVPLQRIQRPDSLGNVREVLTPRNVYCADDAEAEYADYCTMNSATASQLGRGTSAYSCHLRLKGHIARIALILAGLDTAARGAMDALEVSGDIMRMAVRWHSFLTSHNARVLAYEEGVDAMQDARAMRKAIQHHGLRQGCYFTDEDAHYWQSRWPADRRRAALDALAGAGTIKTRYVESEAKGRAKALHFVTQSLRQ